MTAGLARWRKMILLLAAGSSQPTAAQTVGVQGTVVRDWSTRFLDQRLDRLSDTPDPGAKGWAPREVAIHVVRLACKRPAPLACSLCPWECAGLARQLIAEGVVTDIAVDTGRRSLAAHQLKPSRLMRGAIPSRRGTPSAMRLCPHRSTSTGGRCISMPRQQSGTESCAGCGNVPGEA
jgi:transposase